MTKSTSKRLGILAIITWLALFYLIVMAFIWLRNSGLVSNEQPGYGNGFMLLVLLFLWIVWLVFTGTVLFISIGIPHYFLYLNNKHRVSYLYLVKYGSIVLLIFLGLTVFIASQSVTDFSSPQNMVYLMGAIAVCIALILLMTLTHTPIDPKELKKRTTV